jgi:regulator of replication initiation timing
MTDLCEKCEMRRVVSKCCDVNLCHICITKHECNTTTFTNTQLVIVEDRIEQLRGLCNFLTDENKQLKLDNRALYGENQTLTLQLVNLREQLALNTTHTRADNLCVEEPAPKQHSENKTQIEVKPTRASTLRTKKKG